MLDKNSLVSLVLQLMLGLSIVDLYAEFVCY